MRVLYGLAFVVMRPITIPLGYIWRFVKEQYRDGTITYDWIKRMNKLEKEIQERA